MAKKQFSRADRISEQMQRELADIIRTELKDPRVGWVTVTGVDVTRDYSRAVVDLNLPLSTDMAKAFMRAYRKARAWLIETPAAEVARDMRANQAQSLRLGAPDFSAEIPAREALLEHFLRRHPGDVTDPGLAGETVRVPAAEIDPTLQPRSSDSTLR